MSFLEEEKLFRVLTVYADVSGGVRVIADRPGSGGQTAPGKWGRSGAECARPSGGNRLQQNTETMLVQNHIDRISYALPEVINEETGASVLLSWSIPC